MEEISVLTRQVNLQDERKRKISAEPNNEAGKRRNSHLNGNIVNNIGESFFNYLNRFGLDRDSNLLVLPSDNHYYYDFEELKGVTTLVNMKKLNLVRHLSNFLNIIHDTLSPDANFIGCFSDRKSGKGESELSRMYKKLINYLDNKVDLDFDRKDVLKLLESKGFNIIDITEINGITYFNSRKNGYYSRHNSL